MHARQRRRLTATLAGTVLLITGVSTAQAETADTPVPECPWVGSSATPEERAAQVLAEMTDDEKFQIISADRPVRAIDRLCLPGIYQQGGPGGPNQGLTGVTQLPTPLALGATFDPDLAAQYGDVIGAEVRGKGTSLVGAPTLDVLRNPYSGRSYEAYGEDPFLSGVLGAGTVEGIQSNNVIAMTKHFAFYTQQKNRSAPLNHEMDDRTLREVHLAAFERAVRDGGAGAVMCSYSTINGTPICANDELLNGILKGDWGFSGVVAPDWGAQSLGGLTIDQVVNGGLDYEIPQRSAFAQLPSMVAQGRVSMDRIDEMATRILTSMFATGLVDNPVTGSQSAVVTTPEHQAVGLETAIQSTVLLKNEGGLLPLTDPTEIVVIGPGAHDYPITTGGSSAGTVAESVVTALDGIEARAGDGANVEYLAGVEPVTPYNSLLPGLPNLPQSTLTSSTGASGVDVSHYRSDGSLVTQEQVRSVNFDWVSAFAQTSVIYPREQHRPPAGTTRSVWTTTFTAPEAGEYTFDLHTSGHTVVTVDGEEMVVLTPTGRDRSTPVAPNLASHEWTTNLEAGAHMEIRIDAALGTSGKIKLGWEAPPGVVAPAIAEAAQAAEAADVAVVVVNDFNVEGTDKPHLRLPGNQDALVEAVAAANPNTVVVLNTGGPLVLPWTDDVAALLSTWYPGQSAGEALAAVLWGDSDPGGRLPITLPASADATIISDDPSRYPLEDLTVPYTEGHLVGYRWYDSAGVEPLFHFGEGLSYTEMRLQGLSVTPVPNNEGFYRVRVTVKNVGDRLGTAVPQLYVGLPDDAEAAPRQLRGFEKLELEPGESRSVTFDIDPRDLAYWDTETSAWLAPRGTYDFFVGFSSAEEDLQAHRKVVLRRSIEMSGSTPVDPTPVSDPGSGHGNGSGSGHGNGSGSGHGNGSGSGHGNGSGTGHGNGSGTGHGNGSGHDRGSCRPR